VQFLQTDARERWQILQHPESGRCEANRAGLRLTARRPQGYERPVTDRRAAEVPKNETRGRQPEWMALCDEVRRPLLCVHGTDS